MKELIKEKISQCLINENCKHNSLQELRHLYKKLKNEVEINIYNSTSFNETYKYLQESLFYFNEIFKGYYYNPHIQLEINFFENNNSKKKKFIQNVIKE